MNPRDTSGVRPAEAAPDPGTGPAPAIELRGISKAFGPVQANRDISIRVMPGTIHGIIGENGAGKSTLMSILYGFYRADAGEIFINGRRTEITDSQAAIRAGIGMVFQHFKLVQNFTVLENVVLGAEEGALLRPSLARARSLLRQLAEEYELEVDPDAIIEDTPLLIRLKGAGMLPYDEARRLCLSCRCGRGCRPSSPSGRFARPGNRNGRSGSRHPASGMVAAA